MVADPGAPGAGWRVSVRDSRSILQGFQKARSNFLDLGTPLPRREALLDAEYSSAKKAAYRVNRFCVVAFLTAASGMPVSKVTSLPSC